MNSVMNFVFENGNSLALDKSEVKAMFIEVYGEKFYVVLNNSSMNALLHIEENRQCFEELKKELQKDNFVISEDAIVNKKAFKRDTLFLIEVQRKIICYNKIDYCEFSKNENAYSGYIYFEGMKEYLSNIDCQLSKIQLKEKDNFIEFGINNEEFYFINKDNIVCIDKNCKNKKITVYFKNLISTEITFDDDFTLETAYSKLLASL